MRKISLARQRDKQGPELHFSVVSENKTIAALRSCHVIHHSIVWQGIVTLFLLVKKLIIRTWSNSHHVWKSGSVTAVNTILAYICIAKMLDVWAFVWFFLFLHIIEFRGTSKGLSLPKQCWGRNNQDQWNTFLNSVSFEANWLILCSCNWKRESKQKRIWLEGNFWPHGRSGGSPFSVRSFQFNDARITRNYRD